VRKILVMILLIPTLCFADGMGHILTKLNFVAAIKRIAVYTTAGKTKQTLAEKEERKQKFRITFNRIYKEK